jgi:hypothetical protein
LFTEQGCQPCAQPPTWRTGSLYLCPPVTGWPNYATRHRVPFTSPSTTRRAKVDVFQPVSTRGYYYYLLSFTRANFVIGPWAVDLAHKQIRIELNFCYVVCRTLTYLERKLCLLIIFYNLYLLILISKILTVLGIN